MSQNDYHMSADGILKPTLGDDEPSDEKKAEIRERGAAKLGKLKEEIKLAHAELTEKERALAITQAALEQRQEAADRRERELAAREAAILSRESAPAKSEPTKTEKKP